MCNEYIVCNCSLGNKDRLIIINKAMENWLYSLGKDLCYDVVVHCAKYYWPVVSHSLWTCDFWNKSHMCHYKKTRI